MINRKQKQLLKDLALLSVPDNRKSGEETVEAEMPIDTSFYKNNLKELMISSQGCQQVKEATIYQAIMV